MLRCSTCARPSPEKSGAVADCPTCGHSYTEWDGAVDSQHGRWELALLGCAVLVALVFAVAGAA